jgi:GTPase
MNPEKDDGNVEYKLKLIDKTDERIQELATQMRFRCMEGNGECFYNLGVEDDGNLVGVTDEEYEETVNTLKIIAKKNDYYVQILSKDRVTENKSVYEVLIRENNSSKYIDIKVCVAGNVNASKSSTIGCLVTGNLDNGRGLSRMSVFNYVHELKTGRTSSISHEILGYDYKGGIVNYQGLNKLSWGDIVQKSSKIISFFDLAGHEKYLKTTILGLSTSIPNMCMILIAANDGISKMTREHIFLCMTLKIPFIFVISKIDLCRGKENILNETIEGINKILKHPTVRRIPIHIKNNEDIILSSKNIYSNSIAPIFQISNVSGEGLDNLRLFFNIVGEKTKIGDKTNVEYFVDNIFQVKGVGIVLGGHLLSGSIRVGDNLLLGPNVDGSYEPIIIKSIHSKKVNVQTIAYGGYVCLSFKKIDRKIIRKGIVIISPKSEQLAVKTFNAKIDVMRTHATTIKKGYEPLLCINSIRQTVQILEIKDKQNSRNVIKDDNVLRTNDSANVKLKFKYRPEYLKSGSRFIMCEGNLKIVGEVKEIVV